MRYEQVITKNFEVRSISGREFLVMCRWHPDTSTGHLYINGWTGLFLCHSCGAKGSLERMDLELPQITTSNVRDRIAALRKGPPEEKFYPEGWLKQYDMPHGYWSEDRLLPDRVIRQFDLGYDPFTDRVTLPLRDMHGRILGVTYRRLDDGKPKYLHPKGFPTGKHLYGANHLRHEKTVALVEGQVDALRGWSHGIPALGLMGARLTTDQIRVLKMCDIHHVVLMLDNDSAGVSGTVGIHENLKGSGIRVSVGWYRDYWYNVKDPDGLTRPRYRKMFHGSVSIHEWASKVGADAKV